MCLFVTYLVPRGLARKAESVLGKLAVEPAPRLDGRELTEFDHVTTHLGMGCDCGSDVGCFHRGSREQARQGYQARGWGEARIERALDRRASSWEAHERRCARAQVGPELVDRLAALRGLASLRPGARVALLAHEDRGDGAPIVLRGLIEHDLSAAEPVDLARVGPEELHVFA